MYTNSKHLNCLDLNTGTPVTKINFLHIFKLVRKDDFTQNMKYIINIPFYILKQYYNSLLLLSFVVPKTSKILCKNVKDHLRLFLGFLG